MTGESHGDIVLIGGGEHARVVADAALAAGWRVVAYADPVRSMAMDALGAAYFASDDDASAVSRDASMVVAIGGLNGLNARRALVGRLARAAGRWAVVIHPSAVVSPLAVIDEGAVVLAGAVVNAGAHIGSHAIVNTGAIIEHDVAVGPFSHIAPGAVVGGGTVIGQAVFVGLRAGIRDHISIGDEAVVGMGAVVVDAVGTGAMVMGIPARSATPARDKGHGR